MVIVSVATMALNIHTSFVDMLVQVHSLEFSNKICLKRLQLLTVSNSIADMVDVEALIINVNETHFRPSSNKIE